MPISETDARIIAVDWVKAWNSHDLDAIMAHYAPDVEFTSPFVVRLSGEPSGTLHGLDSLRAYFARGLEAFPDLHFELSHILVGLNSVVVYYRSVQDLLSAELMVFDARGKVVKVMAHYCAESNQ